ncbi:MAG TPA: FAD-dependent oxidoreductase, partial [Dehalococcoidia bacterium]|nr:FAD-dependent oxidoreductase [Dehalococcoidia bacterium]
NQLTLGDDSHIKGFRDLAGAVHKYGTKIAVQLQHSSWEVRDGAPVQVGPSPVIVPARVMGISGIPTHELTIEEINEIIDWFAAAAGRAKEAGCDGVEIHGAHQYLVASFLSATTNQRQDKYGGPVENRARLMVEIIKATREVVGPDFPVWPRLNGQEFGIENGVTIEETEQIVPLLVEAGAQAIHVSGYGAGSSAIRAPISDRPGFLVPLAERVRKVTVVPVIAVGRLGAELGEQVLSEGKADFIAIGRRLMADPELPNKSGEGRLDEINPCINCMDCIERPVTDGHGCACAVNAAMGRERDYEITPAAVSRKVVVAGGGPAGMEAARVASRRGHQVVLFEEESALGGQLKVAALPPYKEDIALLTDYMSKQVSEAGVEVRVSTKASPETITGIRPDAVIIATGGLPITPDIPGVKGSNVFTAQDVLAGKVATGQNIVIIGGGMVGCETGHFLAEQGKSVTIVEMLKRMAADVSPMVRRRLMDGLREKNVSLLTQVTCEEIHAGAVTVSAAEGEKQTIPADSVVLAVGYRPDNDLFKALEGKVPVVRCIGDSSEPRRIRETIDDGYRAGLSV